MDFAIFAMPADIKRFFPSIPATLEHGFVVVWKMPWEVSQSYLGGRIESSSACTLIAVKLAELIYRSNIDLPIPSSMLTRMKRRLNKSPTVALRDENISCPSELIHFLTDAIIAGNDHHEKTMLARFKTKNANENFTIPQALKTTGDNFEEVDFLSIRGPIWTELPRVLKFLIKHPAVRSRQRLFMTIIAHERCVLIVFDRSKETFFLFDTHTHLPSNGALVAACSSNSSQYFADWISERIFPESALLDGVSQFEISVLTFRGRLTEFDCALPESALPPIQLFSTYFQPKAALFRQKKPKIVAKHRISATTQRLNVCN